MREPAALIVNTGASGARPELVAAIQQELSRFGPLETFLTEGRGHAEELARAVRAPRLYVLAGDGGFNEVVNGAGGGVAVGFIPAGASNVLPRALRLPRDPLACARALAASESTRVIGLGRVNGRRFAFACGIGLDAALVRAVDARGRRSARRAGDLAFVWELARLLAERRGRLPALVTVDGRLRSAFVLVANCAPYTYAGPVPLRLAPDARFELGLDVVAPGAIRPYDLPRLALGLLALPGLLGRAGVNRLHDVERVTIDCDLPLPLQVDGEDLGDVTEAVVEAERSALTVLVPGKLAS